MACFGYSFIALLLSSVAVGLVGSMCVQPRTAQENLRKLAVANNEMALNIHRELAAQSSGNIFFSPLSLSSAFGMLYYGTKGYAAEELRNALGYNTAGLPERSVHQAFQQYLTEALKNQDPSAYVLNSANAILLDKRLDVVSTYKREVQDLYQAVVEDVDFVNQAPQVLNEINSWVSEKTNGKIDKLLDELDPATILVLLNAVYFKGTWKTMFDHRKTRPETFYNDGLESGAKEVPMMRVIEGFPYASMNDVQALEMPYKGENISMLVLLPNERDGLKSLEKSLTLEKLSTIRNQMYKTKVHLTIPKFKIQYTREMSEDFQSLGVKNIFTGGADFSGISPHPGIFVSQVLHKAVVEVNEEGSEAAAVTGIIANRMRPIFDFTPDFTVNHPFLFAIVDNRNDLILFSGRVTTL